MNFLFSMFILVVLSLILLISSVSAGAPSSSTSCKCYNGGSRDTSVTDRCVCSCPSPYAKPVCAFTTTEMAKVAVTWLQNTTDAVSTFAFTRTQDELSDHLSRALSGTTTTFSPTLDLSFIQRLQQFEAPTSASAAQRQIVAMYLVRGGVVDRLLDDIDDGQINPNSASSRKYYSYIAQDAWLPGLTVSEAGVFSRHFATGNTLGEYTITDDSTLVVNSRQLEFFIAALCVIVAMPLLELILYTVYHPSTTELVNEAAEQEAKIRAAKLREAKLFNKQNNIGPSSSSPAVNDAWRDHEESQLPGRRDDPNASTIYPFDDSPGRNNNEDGIDYDEIAKRIDVEEYAGGTQTKNNGSFVRRKGNNNNNSSFNRNPLSGGSFRRKSGVLNFSQM